MTDQSMTSPAALAYLRLSLTKGLGPILIKRLVSHAGDAHRACQLSAAELVTALDVAPTRGATLASAIAAVDTAAVLGDCQRLGLQILCSDDDLWPIALRQMPDPPPVLFVRGQLLADDTVAIAIVGARQCTLYGREQAEKFARGLAQGGMTVISGGARGIDTAAHYGALRADGRTIVVSGCGLGHCYPPENDGLYDDIINRRAGCIISEMPPDEPPLPRNFPPRNRIIAALSLGTLVVEANLRSGSMITARLAAEDYGREVFAMPGRVDSPASSGTHHLIRCGGAELVESPRDILDSLGLSPVGKSEGFENAATKSPTNSAGPLSRCEDHGSVARGSGKAFREAADIQPKSRPDHQDRDDAANTDRAYQREINQTQLTHEAEPESESQKILFSGPQQKILAAVSDKVPAGVDEICQETQLPAAVVMAELTMLELRGIVRRTAEHSFIRV